MPAQAHQPRKRFGQHFLHETHIIQRIVDEVDPQPQDALLEIGPGLGALTADLIGSGASVHAIEIDRDCITALQDKWGQMPHFTIHQADALEFDYKQLVNSNQCLRLVGNLPYNVATPLMVGLMDHISLFSDMHVMVQLEVAERMVARPGTPHFGRLAVWLQYFCDAKLLFRVSPGAFRPPPKVMSAVVRLVPKADREQVASLVLFNALVKRAFGQRRKMLRTSLRPWVTEDMLQEADLDPLDRPQNVLVSGFIRLANVLHKQGVDLLGD